jgi:phosphate starvation-inducible PhoH-like protein
MARKKQVKRESHLKPKAKIVTSKTENQKNYIRGIIENNIVFCSGPAGSGKSYIAAGMASNHLYRGDIERVIVTRPLVCTGKEIGALPGELQEKINPYLVPMRENLKHFLGALNYNELYQQGKISFEPLEMMRGMTFHDTYMILDEAQNCTYEQIKMFITRMGHNSKVLINGDVNQTDLTRGKSGLESCMKRLKNIEGIAICELTHADIQRNDLIAKVLRALET